MKRSNAVAVCEQCDAAYARMPVGRGEKAVCSRCGGLLYRGHRYTLDLMLAATLSAMIFFVLANAYPIATIEISGERNSARIWDAITAPYLEGDWFISLIAAFTIFFAPLLMLSSLAYVLIPLRVLKRRPAEFAAAMRLVRWVRPWSLIEVFMLGTLVAVIKIHAEAEVYPGVGIWALGALTASLALLHGVDPHQIWDLADEVAA